MTKFNTAPPLPIFTKPADNKEDENAEFGIFLRHQDGRLVDEVVHRLNIEVSASIDCTQCGNCCRSLMINIQPEESTALSAFLKMPLQEFKDEFVEESQQGQLIMNTIPCKFLHNCKCSIYENRFSSCREFPHLHKPGFKNRLFETFMHYNICPIIYHVVEQLKTELSFTYNEEVNSLPK